VRNANSLSSYANAVRSNDHVRALHRAVRECDSAGVDIAGDNAVAEVQPCRWARALGIERQTSELSVQIDAVHHNPGLLAIQENDIWSTLDS
jgi:hypothetical protein